MEQRVFFRVRLDPLHEQAALPVEFRLITLPTRSVDLGGKFEGVGMDTVASHIDNQFFVFSRLAQVHRLLAALSVAEEHGARSAKARSAFGGMEQIPDGFPGADMNQV